MEISFQGKRVLVTGAGRGIGRALAKKLAQGGAEVLALSRTQDTLESLKQEVPSIQTILTDLRDWDATRSVLKDIGQVDLLVNNAAVSVINSFMNLQKEDIDYVFDVNFKAIVNVSQIIARNMISHKKGGVIVNITSLAGTRYFKDEPLYSSTKAAVDMLTKSMAVELAPHKIRVNSVQPTVVWTEMGKLAWSDPEKSAPLLDRTPLGMFADVDDVVNMVMFLLSDKSAMTTGTHVLVDGGYAAR